MAHTWQSTCLAYSTLDFPWRLTHLLLKVNYFKTRPIILNSLVFSLYLAGSVLLFDYFSYFFSTIGLQYIYIYTNKTEIPIHKAVQ